MTLSQQIQELAKCSKAEVYDPTCVKCNYVRDVLTEARKKWVEEEIDYWQQARKVEVLSDEHQSIAAFQISRLEAELKALDR